MAFAMTKTICVQLIMVTVMMHFNPGSRLFFISKFNIRGSTLAKRGSALVITVMNQRTR